MRPAETNVLYRFSSLERLEKSLRLGEFCLVSASNIEAIEGDAERQDGEIDRSFEVDSSRVKITHSATGQNIPLGSNITIECSTESDYYMLCFSTQKSSINYELFSGSEGYIAIHDRVEFTRRLYAAVDEHLPSWPCANASVAYGLTQHEYGAPFRKPEKYLFQFEWRYVWLPPRNTERLENLIVRIGGLEDIASVHAKG